MSDIKKIKDDKKEVELTRKISKEESYKIINKFFREVVDNNDLDLSTTFSIIY